MLRIKILGFNPTRPCIYTFWHSHIFPLIYTHRKQGIGVLVSRHRDGELIGKVLRTFGFQLARGSHTRKGELGIIQLRNILSNGFSVAITPDGPRGPRWVFKKGALFLSKEENVPIVLVGVGFSRYIQFSSWDRFTFPLPFSKVVIYLSNFTLVENLNEDTSSLYTNLLTSYTLLAQRLAQNPNKSKGT